MTVEDAKAISRLAAVDPSKGMVLDTASLKSLVAMARVVEEFIASGQVRFV